MTLHHQITQFSTALFNFFTNFLKYQYVFENAFNFHTIFQRKNISTYLYGFPCSN